MPILFDITVKTIKCKTGIRSLVTVQCTDSSGAKPAVRHQSCFFNSQSVFDARLGQARIAEDKLEEIKRAVNFALMVHNENTTIKRIHMDADQLQQLGFNILATAARGIVSESAKPVEA